MLKIFILGIAFGALCQIEASLFEDATFSLMKQLLINDGYSEARAECVTKVLQSTGVLNDFNIHNAMDPKRLLEKVRAKAQFTDFVCSLNGMLCVAICCVAVIGICCCCCCGCRKKRSTENPIIIRMGAPQLPSKNADVPYIRMDNV